MVKNVLRFTNLCKILTPPPHPQLILMFISFHVNSSMKHIKLLIDFSLLFILLPMKTLTSINYSRSRAKLIGLVP